MLSEKGKVLPTFPIEYVRKGLPQKTMKVGMDRSDIFDSLESFFIMLPGPGLTKLVNPKLVNPKLVNPKLVNPKLVNPKLVNPKLVNPKLVNP